MNNVLSFKPSHNLKPSNSHKSAKRTSFFAFSLACLFAVPSFVMAQPQTLEEKASYSIGVNFTNSIKMQGINLNNQYVLQGVSDGLSGKKTLLTDDDMKKALEEFKANLIAEQSKVQQEQMSKNKKLGDAFLAANKTKEGVVTLESGLQYKVIKSGTGPSPKLTDKVTTHYRGTLLDGTEFDSSYSRNKPTTFPVKGVIKGWTEALQIMHVGDKWQLFIPAELAYGQKSVGGIIEPNSTLTFEIELLSIN